MSGIYIKGMEMPKRCGECIFDVSGVGGCIINLNTEPKNKLTHSCPLIELPDNGDTVKDAVVIVRCKDCEFYTADERWCRRLGLCGAFDPDDFCSHAERSVTVCPLHSDDEVTEYCSQCGARMDAPDKPKQISAEFAKLMREGEIQVRWKR